MAQITTFFFATLPGDNIRAVAEKLSKTVAEASQDGFTILSVQPHVGVVDGATCTVGYTLLATKNHSTGTHDELPIVVAVS